MHHCFKLLCLLCCCQIQLSGQNIFRTSCNGDISRLDSLLTSHALNAQDNRGRTLLHWAVACRQKEIFDYLIRRGIDLNTPDHQGKSPLHIAVNFNNEEFLDYLAQVQPNDDWKTKFGGELLSLAILERNISMVKKLLDLHIDVHATNHKGNAPLQISDRLGEDEISKLLISYGAERSTDDAITYTGNYLDQNLPSEKATIFAPNFISTEEYEFGSVFNQDMTEFYYGVDVNGKTEIRRSIKNQHNSWSQPEVILSHETYGYNDPFLSPDDQRLYFITQQPWDGSNSPRDDHDIAYIQREGASWSEPMSAGPNINTTGPEYYISFTSTGTMYFASDKHATEENKGSDLDIYYAEYANGQFQEAVRLGPSINTNAYEADVFIDPNESYMIFCANRSEGLGRGDLYISYKDKNGQWTPSMNMGATINTVNHELCPYVTPDGKYLLYTSNEDIYWVSTDILEQLRR